MTYGVRNPERLDAGAIIPPIVDPMGRNWDQPPRSAITIDAENALMTKATFDALHEYTTTVPTGVYNGKMWKAQQHDGLSRDGRILIRDDKPWLLLWYGPCDKPGHCSVNSREIILL